MDVQKTLDLPNADEAVKDVMKEVTEHADDIVHTPGVEWKMTKTIERNGKVENITVIVSDAPGNVGSIQTVVIAE